MTAPDAAHPPVDNFLHHPRSTDWPVHRRLLAAGESGVAEFREANDNFTTQEIGKRNAVAIPAATIAHLDPGGVTACP